MNRPYFSFIINIDYFGMIFAVGLVPLIRILLVFAVASVVFCDILGVAPLSVFTALIAILTFIFKIINMEENLKIMIRRWVMACLGRFGLS